MSNESKRTQGSPGDFEDKINAAMADLELDEDDDFHDADFYDEEADAPFDSLDQDDQDEENPDEEAEEEEEAVQDSPEEDFEEDFEEASQEDDFDEDAEEEYPEEEEYEGAEEDFSEEEEPAQKELQVELIQPHSQGKKHSRKSGRGGEHSRSARPTRISYVPI